MSNKEIRELSNEELNKKIAEYKEECVLQCYDNWSGAVGHWLLAVEMSELLNF